MTQEHPNITLARRYHEAVSAGPSDDELAEFLAADVVHREMPNALFPHGAERDLAAMQEAGRRGREALARQRFEVLNAVADGDQVALEVLWEGTLAVPYGALPAGHTLRAHIATFLRVRDGKIVEQRNYDCYEPPDPA
ncbi:nuclear transport factor 2 family protein [Actinomadura sp. SCN-SB]|uniref:nuclear transport factor 2 family protein n=1 Tax=Actinomadura sp. SCN-SB TaxID=3373092 RepID=UPI0037535D69